MCKVRMHDAGQSAFLGGFWPMELRRGDMGFSNARTTMEYRSESEYAL